MLFRSLATIIFSGKQLLTLINDILDLSKIETGKMQVSTEVFNPAGLIVQVCDALSPLLLQNNNRLILDIDKDSMRDLNTDRGKLQQIITNLFSNACKFTKDGEITVSAHIKHDRLIIGVADTGIGMTKAQQSRVFEAFTQAESSTDPITPACTNPWCCVRFSAESKRSLTSPGASEWSRIPSAAMRP